MQAFPLNAANISQTLFKQNEKLIVPGDSVSAAFQNLASLNGINSMPQELHNMETLMPAYLEQVHVSTYYQDNPWPGLTENLKYGVPPMGGNIDPNQSPGYRPGNTLRSNISSLQGNSPKRKSVLSQVKNMQIIKENFGNIRWN